MSTGVSARWWDRVDHALRAAETWLIVVILGGLILFGGAQILLRNVFSIGFAWGDGLTRLAVLWLALLGALAATRDGRHITLGVATRWLPERVKRLVAAFADVFAAGICGVLAFHAGIFVRDSREFGDLLLTDIPAWWLQAIMPVAFALMACQFLVQAARHLRGKAPAGAAL